MNYTKTKKQSANEATKMIPEPVIEIHLMVNDLQI
jgi:hypothetical protein